MKEEKESLADQIENSPQKEWLDHNQNLLMDKLEKTIHVPFQTLPYIEQKVEEFVKKYGNYVPLLERRSAGLGKEQWLRSALLSAMQERDRQLIEMLEGMKKKDTVPRKALNEDMNGRTDAFNQALSDAITKIRAEV
jgi:hypothetical protein